MLPIGLGVGLAVPTLMRVSTSTSWLRLQKGLSKRLSVSDRRAKVLRLTRAGEKRLQAALIAWSQAQERFESHFGSKRSAEMRALMRAIVRSSFEPTGRSVEH
jgi:hypothetical protein